ncbi:MAG: hypothetical protein LBC69_01830 [Eubacteriaceae bacterium]|jgi:hypothetical protein|nr:hypothetical protein [Eubacteriaceae bacterium]
MGMKRITAIALAIALAVTFAACGTNNQAERDLKVQLELVNNMNAPALKLVYGASATQEQDSALQNYGVTSDQAIEVIVAYFDRFAYEIVSSEESGDTATVKTKIVMTNFASLMPRVTQDILQNNLSGILSGGDDIAPKVVESIVKVLKTGDVGTKSTEVDIHLSKNGGSTYRIIADEGFVDAISGGGIAYMRQQGLNEQADMLLAMIQSYIGQSGAEISQ